MCCAIRITCNRNFPAFSESIHTSCSTAGTVREILTLHRPDEVLREEIAAHDEPDVEQSGQHEGLGSGLPELVDARVGAERRHGHRQQEGVDVFDRAVERDFAHGGGAAQLLQQRVEADHADESEGEPRNRDAALLLLSGGFGDRSAGTGCGRAAASGQREAHDDEHRGQQHDADHLRDGRRAGDAQRVGRVHGVARSGHVGHLVERAARVDRHARVREPVEQPRAVHDRVEEHRERAEDHDRRDGDGGLVPFAPDYRLGAQHGRGAADGAARGGHQRRVGVDAQQAAQRYAAQDGHRHDNQVDGQRRESDGRHLGQRQSESVEDDAPAENLLRAELDARDPRLGQFVAQAVGIEHAEDDADDQRAEREPSDEGDFGDVERREREECDQQDAVKGVCPVAFFQHAITFFDSAAKIAPFIEL